MKKIIFLIMKTLLCSCSNSESNFSEKDLKLIIDGRITSRGCNNFDRLISSSGKISGIENEILAVSYIVHGCGGTLFYPDFIIIDKVSKKILSSPSLDATKIGDIKAIKIKDNLLAFSKADFKQIYILYSYEIEKVPGIFAAKFDFLLSERSLDALLV